MSGATMMSGEIKDAIEAELCDCLHTKADHHGAFGDGACGVCILASPTAVGPCKCARFSWRCFIWKPGRTPKAIK